jgi:hypothetical protein
MVRSAEVLAPTPLLGPSCVLSPGHAAIDTAASCVARAGAAVVVTVSVVPLIVHVPSGIAQLAFSVGGVLNPLVLSANVNALPADPLCDGFGTVTAGPPANVAVTEVFAVMLNVQVVLVLPAHAPPDQLVNVAPEFGTAVSVIAVPDANEVPVGDCVVVPGPVAVVVSVYCGAANVAITDESCERLNTHTGFLLPPHAPAFQPVNVAPAFGVAVTVICVPETNVVPIGDCVTVPGPSTPTLSVYAGANSAVADTFDEMLKLQTRFVLPLHGPLSHCSNPFPAAGTAVRVIDVFGANDVPTGDCVIDPYAGGKTVVTSVYWLGLVNVAVRVVFALSVA